MSPQPGDKLGPYEIVAAIGKGGMGEVYRARDSRLGRDVAIKVSTQAFDERFEREARTIAALNHPNICTLHDIGPDYLVMELVEGVTLSDRIKEGPIPLDESLAIARQIANALEAAHDQGVVHRDLKPGNIILKPDGSVKVLDFGLAKVSSGVTTELSQNSPTISIAATQAGVILGTAAYMAPEQARGKSVDKRADIWAFGVVLYEMLTGKRLFDGEDLTDTLARVVRDKPETSPVPAKVRRLLDRCLEKDPKNRLRDISVAWELIDLNSPQSAAQISAPARSRWSWLAWAVAGSATVAAVAVTFLWLRAPKPEMIFAKFQINPPAGTQYINPLGATAISPDGQYIVTAAGEQANAGLWLRPLNSLDARLLQGTQGALLPFWSPDNKSIGFYQNGKLMRSDIVGGAPQVLCDAVLNSWAGGTWSRDGTILFSSGTGLFQVPSSGGVPKLVMQADSGKNEVVLGYPQFLPDGKQFLYGVGNTDGSRSGMYVGSLDDPTRHVLILATSTKALYVPAAETKKGLLLWLREQTLLAQPFDVNKLELEGDPAPLAEGVMNAGAARAAFWTSEAGILVIRTGTSSNANRTLTWFDRKGNPVAKVADPEGYGELSLSHDGSQVAAFRRDSIGEDLWLIDLTRGSSSRLTTDKGNESYPVWSPDGKQIAFSSNSNSKAYNLYVKAAGVTGQETLLFADDRNKAALDWSRDGRYFLFASIAGKEQHLWYLPMGAGDQKPVQYLSTSFIESGGHFSPNGQWMAYASNVSGRSEIYVSPFPDAAAAPAVLVSSGVGGTMPRWRPDGKTILYISGDNKLMEVEVTPGSTVKAGVPKALFDLPGVAGSGDQNGFPWDVSPDGQRFLINRPTEQQAATPPLTVLMNWQATLKK